MNKTTVYTSDPDYAKAVCLAQTGWYPDAIRQVDSGDEYQPTAWMCFENAADAELWDKQL